MRPDSPVNILMVDDQPAKLLSYEAILRDLNENLIKVTSGREALDQLLKTEIALVLLDVSMPDINGFELADPIERDDQGALEWRSVEGRGCVRAMVFVERDRPLVKIVFADLLLDRPPVMPKIRRVD